MGLKRHAIARALITESGGDFDADRLELPHRIGELSEQFSVTYSTMHRHLNGLQTDGILVARQPLVLSPTALTNLHQTPPPNSTRPPLRLITTATAGQTSAEEPVTPPAVEALWGLASQALQNRDHLALQTIVDGLVTIAANTTPTANRDVKEPQSRFRDGFRDASRNRDTDRREPSRNHESELKNSIPSTSTDREPSRNRDTEHRESSRNNDPPTYGIAAVDNAVERAWSQLTFNADADTTPAWLRPDHHPAPKAWSADELDALRQCWQAKTGENLSAPLAAILRLWTPTQATNAMDAVCSDPKITSKGGRLRTAAVLGYHQYFPTESAPPLPYWDTWTKDSQNPAVDLTDLKARLEALSAITGSDVYPIRVAAAVAPYSAHLDDIAQWGCVAIDRHVIESTLTDYQQPATRNQP